MSLSYKGCLAAYLLLATYLLLAAGCSEETAPPAAQRIQDWIYTGQLDSLTAHASFELRQRFEEQGGIERFYTRVIQKLGPETEQLSQSLFRRGSVTHLVRTVRYQMDSIPRNLWIAYSPDGTIRQLSLRVADKTLCTSRAKPRVCLRLPFTGSWTVLNGGPLREENRHAVDPQQCYGVEWHLTREGVAHRGAGRQNADYFAYGRPVLAPASGVVTAVEDRVVENVPGTPNYYAPSGNHVILDHHTGEYSVLSCLQPGTVRVAVGDRVIAGEPVGLCGNSGLSREPKIHLHLQSRASAGMAKPMGFTQLRVDGKRVPYWRPVAGQRTESLWRGVSHVAEQ